jgi:RNA polymerase sigma-70 factor (ECF subfamily)
MDEQALIASAQKGDVRAFNQLVRLYQSMAYNLAYRILGNSESAADATQNAFISAFKAMPKFRGGSFKAWILRIVTNACYDLLRSKQRKPTESLDDLDIEQDHITYLRDEGERPDEALERQELNKAIEQGIYSLPFDQRTIVVLADIQGLSYQEIAEATDLSLGTVKSRLSRGRRKLRDYLIEHQGELLPSRYRLRSDPKRQGSGSTESRG